MRRAGLTAVITGMLALVLALAGAAQAATQQRRYAPFTAAGEPDPALRIGERLADATCEGSPVSGRVDAWRCVAGDLILDPCFSSPSQPVAVCPTDPYTGTADLLDDPAYGDRFDGASEQATVWAVRTAGRTCRSSTGARTEVRGRVPTFFCRPTFTVSVWGSLDRRRPTWRALVGRDDHPRAWRRRAVPIAWR
jgi:hypothetical protein